jgi:shikimate dehydrogenase
MFLTGIIGYPLQTTVSPALHNTAFRTLGIDGMYLRFPVKAPDLHAAVDGLHALGFAGVNVTIPYKERVADLVHHLVGTARDIGAVNTIVNQNNTLYGYNTDIYGFRQSLDDHHIMIKGKQVMVLGAGGAGSACAYVIQSMEPKNMVIADRVRKRSRMCMRRFGGQDIALKAVSMVIKEIDVVVNATPANLQQDIVPHLKAGSVYYDINYTYKMMKRQGVKIVNGMRMLILQGAQSFCLWTGQEMPVARVLKEMGLKRWLE